MADLKIKNIRITGNLNFHKNELHTDPRLTLDEHIMDLISMNVTGSSTGLTGIIFHSLKSSPDGTLTVDFEGVVDHLEGMENIQEIEQVWGV